MGKIYQLKAQDSSNIYPVTLGDSVVVNVKDNKATLNNILIDFVDNWPQIEWLDL